MKLNAIDLSTKLRKIITDEYKNDDEKVESLFQEYFNFVFNQAKDNYSLFYEALLRKYTDTEKNLDPPSECGDNSILVAAKMANVKVMEALLKLSELSIGSKEFFAGKKFLRNHKYLREIKGKTGKIPHQNAFFASQDKSGNNLLSIFIKNNGGLDFATKMINAGADVNSGNDESTILSYSISSGNVALINLLLQSDLDPKKHLSAIVRSAAGPESENYEIVFKILLNRLKIENIEEKRLFLSNLLLFSAYSCNEYIIKKLLKKGANAEIINNLKMSFLHIASGNINFEKFASRDLTVQLETSPIFSMKIIRTILQKTSSKVNAIKRIINRSNSLNKENRLRQTPLQIAINNRNMPMLVVLIDNGADPFLKNTKNLTILDILYQKEKDARSESLILHDHNTEPTVVSLQTPAKSFFYAAKKYILKKRDVNGQFPLIRYIMEKNLPMVESLLLAGAEVLQDQLEMALETAQKISTPQITSLLEKYYKKTKILSTSLEIEDVSSDEYFFSPDFFSRRFKDRFSRERDE